jgi:hypothetical protein
MNCPKCAGLLIQEEIQEHSGRFQGWRCIQCGLRLDQTIVQNRLTAEPEEPSAELDEAAAPPAAKPASRQRRQSGRA